MPPPSSSSASSSRRGRRRNRRRGRKKDEAEEVRDWAALPLDAITAILGKLDHIEILLGPGKVCHSWRRAARDEPALWRRIDMRGHPELDRRVNLYGMAQEAIRRARGQCEAFWAEDIGGDSFVFFLGHTYVRDRTSICFFKNIQIHGPCMSIKFDPGLQN